MASKENFGMIKEQLDKIIAELPESVTLVAVSKTKPNEDILEAYEAGQRIFGENKVQELVSKYESLPKDIEWHMIGHLQRNKVKYLAGFVSLIHGVDSLRLLEEINKQAEKNDRIQPVLLQMHIATEETKFGLDESELAEVIKVLHNNRNVKVRGLMGMATFTDDISVIKSEFRKLAAIYNQYKDKINWDILSMGMSGDYKIAIEEGSSMVKNREFHFW